MHTQHTHSCAACTELLCGSMPLWYSYICVSVYVSKIDFPCKPPDCEASECYFVVNGLEHRIGKQCMWGSNKNPDDIVRVVVRESDGRGWGGAPARGIDHGRRARGLLRGGSNQAPNRDPLTLRNATRTGLRTNNVILFYFLRFFLLVVTIQN